MREGSGIGFLAGAAQGGAITLLLISVGIYTFWREILAVSFLVFLIWVVFRIIASWREE